MTNRHLRKLNLNMNKRNEKQEPLDCLNQGVFDVNGTLTPAGTARVKKRPSGTESIRLEHKTTLVLNRAFKLIKCRKY